VRPPPCLGMITDNPADGWRRVPDNVVRLVKVAGALALELRRLDAVGDPGDRAWWEPPTGRIHVQSRHKQASWHAALVPGVTVSASEPEGDLWVLIKRAGFLAPLARGQNAIGRIMGGPNPMTAAITGGLVGAGLGYGAGWVGEQFLPDEQFERGRLRRSMALAGAGLGAMPGFASGMAQARIPEAGGSTAPGLGKFIDPAPWLSGYSYGKHAMFDDAAGDFADSTGFMHMPSIPVDAFNKAIWNDVGARPNPFGTKSPWGSNSQPLTTPPNVASFASGIVAGAGAATGQRKVSPIQVAATAGLSAGVGYLGGLTVGKVFGALAGLKPEAQEQLRRTGMWAGLITGAVNGLFH
jgi:hypothetical protein